MPDVASLRNRRLHVNVVVVVIRGMVYDPVDTICVHVLLTISVPSIGVVLV